MRLIASSISASVVVAPKLKRTDETQAVIGNTHGHQGRRRARRAAGTGRAQRGRDAPQIELHQEGIAIETGKAKIESLGKSLVTLIRAIADRRGEVPVRGSGRIQVGRARPSSVWIAPETGRATSESAAASPTTRGTAMVPGRRPCCCPPPKSREPSRTPLRTRRRPIPTGPWNLCALAARVVTPRS